MDLEQLLKDIAIRFRERGVRYGLTGGYAVAIHGYPRTTVDLDFLVDRSDLPKVDEILHDMGYEIRHRSDNVSQFVSSREGLWEIDFIHAFREASMRMLERAQATRLFPEGPQVMVLTVEDVIGLKVQAIANAPHRKSQDLADIQNLIEAHEKSIDWELIQDYFALFDMLDVFEKLRTRVWQD